VHIPITDVIKPYATWECYLSDITRAVITGWAESVCNRCKFTLLGLITHKIQHTLCYFTHNWERRIYVDVKYVYTNTLRTVL